MFADLEESVKFSADQILTQETRDSLTSFSNAGLKSIDYAQYINLIASQVSTLGVDSTISALETVRNEFIRLSQVRCKPYILYSNCLDASKELCMISQAVGFQFTYLLMQA